MGNSVVFSYQETLLNHQTLLIQILTSIFAQKRFEVSEPTVVVVGDSTTETRWRNIWILNHNASVWRSRGQGSNLFGEATDAPCKLPLRNDEEEDDDDDDDIPSVWAGEIIVCI